MPTAKWSKRVTRKNAAQLLVGRTITRVALCTQDGGDGLLALDLDNGAQLSLLGRSTDTDVIVTGMYRSDPPKKGGTDVR